MPYEIERKFCFIGNLEDLEKNVKLKKYKKVEIEQGYIIQIRDKCVRLRKEDDEYVYTVKSGKGEKRIENEINYSKEVFNRVWHLTEGKQIIKTRYKIPYGNLIFEVDVFHGHLESLVLVEVEFKSIKESQKFIPTELFGKELTDDLRFTNYSLSVYGIPV